MEEYIRKKQKKGRIKNYVIGVTISILLVIIVALVYILYTNIQIQTNNINNQYEATRLSQTVEEVKKENETITQMLERVNESIVGISKLKNTGSSIFIENSTSKLGLGTGMIVSENGYILTNEHVSGGKYSNCFITLFNRKKLSRQCSLVKYGLRFINC